MCINFINSIKKIKFVYFINSYTIIIVILTKIIITTIIHTHILVRFKSLFYLILMILTDKTNCVSQKMRLFLKQKKKDFQKFCQIESYEPANHEHVQYSIISWGTFGLSYCSNVGWHEVEKSLALLRVNENPCCSDSGLQQLFCNIGSCVSHMNLLHNTTQIQYWVPVRQVSWPIKNRGTIDIKAGTGSFCTVCSCQVMLKNLIRNTIKVVRSRNH